MTFFRALKVTIALLFLCSSEANAFSYANPENWGQTYPSCDSNNQSPIDIVTHHALHQTSLDGSFDMSDSFFQPIKTSLLENTGDYYKLTPFGDAIQIIGGGGLEKYPLTFQNLILHFGSENNPYGAEHTIDGHRYPAEMQLMFTNDQIPELEKGSVVIWSFFLGIYTDEDKYKRGGSFDTLVSELESVSSSVSSKNVSDINLSSLVPIFNAWSFNRYYRYSGSLSFPPCNAGVEWTIFKDPIPIAKHQYLKMVRGKTENDEALVNNYRPTQPIGVRLVGRTGLVAGHLALAMDIRVNLNGGAIIAALVAVRWIF